MILLLFRLIVDLPADLFVTVELEPPEISATVTLEPTYTATVEVE